MTLNQPTPWKFSAYATDAITAYSYTDRQPMARKYDIFLD